MLSVEEIKHLHAACHQEKLPQLVVRDEAILSMLLNTGVRASKLCGLTMEGVFLDPKDSYH